MCLAFEFTKNVWMNFVKMPEFALTPVKNDEITRNLKNYEQEIQDTIEQNNIRLSENFQRDNRAQTHVWPQPLVSY
jgi:hypothetical protein